MTARRRSPPRPPGWWWRRPPGRRARRGGPAPARPRSRSRPGRQVKPPSLRPGVAHGQHGGDDGVDPAFEVTGDDGDVAPLVGPERVAPAGQGVGAPLPQGVAEVVDEGGVPGQEVGPVEDDADGGPGRVERRVVRAAPVDPLVGDRFRRGVAVRRGGAEDLVGHEPQQVGGVGRSAVEQVGEGGGDHPGGDGGGGSELRVERRLAPEGQERRRGVRRRPRPGRRTAAPTPAARPRSRTTTASTPSRPGAASRAAGDPARTGGKPSGSISMAARRARISVSAVERKRITLTPEWGRGDGAAVTGSDDAGGDEPLDGGHVEVRLDQVGEPVELGVPGGGERDARGTWVLPRRAATAAEERRPEPVGLEQPVEAGADDRAVGVGRALRLGSPPVGEGDPGGVGGRAAVVDLVAGHRMRAVARPGAPWPAGAGPGDLAGFEVGFGREAAESVDHAGAALDPVVDARGRASGSRRRSRGRWSTARGPAAPRRSPGPAARRDRRRWPWCRAGSRGRGRRGRRAW